jgi:hypothetical protein
MHEPTPDLRMLDAEWRRCRRDARTLTVLEVVQTALGVGILVVVAMCGIVAITHAAVVAGAVALPLGLALAVSIALLLLGLAFRIRVSHALLSQDLFRLDCARRSAAEQESASRAATGPYRRSAADAPGVCTRCLFHARR